MKRFALLALIAVAAIAGCNSIKNIDLGLNSKTPYETYKESLIQAGLSETALGKRWIKAGDSLRDSTEIAVPYSEAGYFSASQPEARILTFTAAEGVVLRIRVKPMGAPGLNYFIDLFINKKENELERLASAEKDSLWLQYETEDKGEYTLRIQPELLAEGYYELTIETFPALAFPVAGKNWKAIGSLFGAPRDGGRRRHEGVDIFATKLTPAIAAVDGRVFRVSNYGLGGKAVWVWDSKRNISLYYAHLDSQTVRMGQRVAIGDTLGLVGNTGNARYTPPHLHFGVYKRGSGARDPYPFLHQPALTPASYAEKIGEAHSWKLISAVKGNIRQAPGLHGKVLTQASRNVPVFVTGVSGEWYSVTLPDLTKGFVHHSIVTDLAKVVSFTPDESIEVFDNLSLNRVAIGLCGKEIVTCYGTFREYALIKYHDRYGWIYRGEA